MIDPLGRFAAEHAVALEALRKLETAVRALEAGEHAAAHLATVREVHGILTTQVRQHNDDEERALFPLLEGMAPSALFEAEHEELRGLEDELLRALDGAAPGQDVIGPALDIVDLLRAHIERENGVLFPMARALLGDKGLAMVSRRLGG